MKIHEILKMPKVSEDVHESIFRSYHILEKVKEWLSEYRYDKSQILDLLQEMQE